MPDSEDYIDVARRKLLHYPSPFFSGVIMKKNIGLLIGLLVLSMTVLAGFGALIGSAFGNVLIGALIGGAIPLVWCSLAFCLMYGISILAKRH